MLKSEIKKHSAFFGIFLGIIVVVFAVLVTVTLLARNSWKKGLSTEVQAVLNSYEKDSYTVNKFIDLNSPLATSSAVFSLIKKGAPSNSECYGIIIRIPTAAGPAPAVFVYNGGVEVLFAGFCGDFGKARGLFDIELSSENIRYWESRIPGIIEKSTARQVR